MPAGRLLFTFALVVSVVVCAGAGESAPARSTRPGGLVVHGYPYANRCPEAGEEELVDRWHMYACNCTSYVAWALHANHQRTDWFVAGSILYAGALTTLALLGGRRPSFYDGRG